VGSIENRTSHRWQLGTTPGKVVIGFQLLLNADRLESMKEGMRPLFLLPCSDLANASDEEIARMVEELGKELGLPGVREESEAEQEKE
jgi:hypothetical protein